MRHRWEDDYDYPMSETFRRDAYRLHGCDPGQEEPTKAPYPEEIDNPYILHEQPSPRQERKGVVDLHKEVAILKGEVLYLLGKETQRSDKRRKGKY